MGRFRYPKPILDKRETELLEELTKNYAKFIEPSTIKKFADKIGDIIPQTIIDNGKDISNIISKKEFIKTILKHTTKGFGEFQKQTSKVTLSKNAVVSKYKKNGLNLSKYEQICALRSYDLVRAINSEKTTNIMIAAINGGATGLWGLLGVPFNLVISIFLYFRVVQSIAMSFGYDTKNDSAELDIAANVMIMSLSPNKEGGVETVSGMLGKMMITTEISALKRAMAKPFKEMAKKGGAELFYVQIRALAHKSAKKALKNASEKEFEFGIFKKTMEEIARRLPKETTKKALPFVSALIGAFSDTYYMNKVIYGAMLIYHKRFLIEKEKRVLALRPSKKKVIRQTKRKKIKN